MWRKITALLLSVSLIAMMIVPTAAAKETATQVKTAAFIGDSLSAGFRMDFGLSQAYDYDLCLKQDKTDGSSNYYWAYPFQFGELVYGEDLYQYGALAKDNNGNYVDNEVQSSILNYGISGAQADDINHILRNEDLRASSAVNALRAGFVDAAEKDPLFYENMRNNVGNADLVALAVGGNDIYQNFVNDFQASPKAGFLGNLFYSISNNLMMAQPMGNVIQMLNGMFGGYPVASGSEFFPVASDSDMSSDPGAMDLKNINWGMEFLNFLAYYSKLNIGIYFMGGGKNSILSQWKDNYQAIVEQIGNLQEEAGNQNGQIALISQFNPFGTQNYINLMQERLNSDEFRAIFREDARTVARIVRTLLNKLTAASIYEVVNPSKWQSKVAEALGWAFDQLLPLLDLDVEYVYGDEPTWYCNFDPSKDPTLEGKDLTLYYDYMDAYNAYMENPYDPAAYATYMEKTTAYMSSELYGLMMAAIYNLENWTKVEDPSGIDPMTAYSEGYMCFDIPTAEFNTEDNEAMYELLADLSYPMMVSMIGRGLQPVYDEMNTFIKSLADKSETDNIVYVDISDAPSNGRFDPHPNESGHTWIANRIYEQMVEINGGTAFKGGNYTAGAVKKDVKTDDVEEDITPASYREVVIDWMKLIVKRSLPVVSALANSPVFAESPFAPVASRVLTALMEFTGAVTVSAPVAYPAVDLTTGSLTLRESAASPLSALMAFTAAHF